MEQRPFWVGLQFPEAHFLDRPSVGYLWSTTLVHVSFDNHLSFGACHKSLSKAAFCNRLYLSGLLHHDEATWSLFESKHSTHRACLGQAYGAPRTPFFVHFYSPNQSQSHRSQIEATSMLYLNYLLFRHVDVSLLCFLLLWRIPSHQQSTGRQIKFGLTLSLNICLISRPSLAYAFIRLLYSIIKLVLWSHVPRLPSILLTYWTESLRLNFIASAT